MAYPCDGDCAHGQQYTFFSFWPIAKLSLTASASLRQAVERWLCRSWQNHRSSRISAALSSSSSMQLLTSHWSWPQATKCCHRPGRRALRVQSKKGFGSEAEARVATSRQVKSSAQTQVVHSTKGVISSLKGVQQGDQAKRERRDSSKTQNVPQRSNAPADKALTTDRPGEDQADPEFDNRLAALRSQSQSRPQAPEQSGQSPLGDVPSSSSSSSSRPQGQPRSIYDNPPPVGQTLFGIKPKSEQEKAGGGGFGTNQIAVSIGSLILGIIILLATGVTDIFPGTRPKSGPAPVSQERALDDSQRQELENKAAQYEEQLQKDEKNAYALEGGGATYAALGSYEKATSLLTRLTQQRPEDASSWRLLAEVKADQQDWKGSEGAYERAMAESKELSLDLLQGLTGVLAADSRPERAVDVIRGAEKTLSQRKASLDAAPTGPASSTSPPESSAPAEEYEVNQAELDLLLGKVYSGWGGHVGDAYDIYDRLIKREPKDFRGYLAKGAVYKSQGRKSDAQRMFIQARYLAPGNVKPLVERLSVM